MEYPRFSEFAKEDKHLEGPKKRIDEALNLEILITGYKISKSRVFLVDSTGIDFLGYRTFRDYSLLRVSAARRFKAKIRFIEENHESMEPQTIISTVMSYMGWVGFCNGYNLQRKYVTENDKLVYILNRAADKLDIDKSNIPNVVNFMQDKSNIQKPWRELGPIEKRADGWVIKDLLIRWNEATEAKQTDQGEETEYIYEACRFDYLLPVEIEPGKESVEYYLEAAKDVILKLAQDRLAQAVGFQ